MQFQSWRDVRLPLSCFEHICTILVRQLRTELSLARRSFFPSLTLGERRFVVALFGTCILGAVFAWVAVSRLSDSGPTSQYEIAFSYWSGVAGFVGAAAGFWSSYGRWFGHAGAGGWANAVIGSLAISGIGSVVAGSLILPIYGTMFGPLQLITTMIDKPLLALSWLGMLICAHGLLVSWRSERDSIFIGPIR